MSANLSDVQFAQDATLCIAAAAPKYRDTNLLVLVDKLNDFLGSLNASDIDIAGFLGCSVDEVSLLSDCLSGDIPDTVSNLEQLGPTLPHPIYNTSALPLAIFFCVFSTIIIVLSFYTKYIVSKSYRLSLHQWLLLFGYAMTMVLNVFIIYLSSNPNIKHLMVYDVTWNGYVSYSILSETRDLIYSWALFCIKASLLLLYYKIVAVSIRSLRWVIVVTTAICLLSAVAFFLNTLFVCGSKIDNYKYILVSVCSDRQATIISYTSIITASLNLATDVILWLIPIRIVMKLSTGLERSVGTGVLVVGLVACLSSASRLASIYSADFSSRTGTSHLLPVGMTTMIELNLGIFCTCARALRSFFVHYFPKFFNTTNTNSPNSGAFFKMVSPTSSSAQKTDKSLPSVTDTRVSGVESDV